MKKLNVGLCGLGTVGSGVVNLLAKNHQEIQEKTGVDLHLSLIGARRKNPLCEPHTIPMVSDIFAVVDRDDVEVIVELIGGTTTAKELVVSAIKNKKHVVTANKALIAEHGNALFALAKKHGVMLAYEAAVAGGIPIIKLLKEGLAANSLQTITGIINGTCNFILTEMLRQQADFAEILKQAQEKGYAEADPAFDIDGIDAAHKITICASLAFNLPLCFDQVHIEGIRDIDLADVNYAHELDYVIKHLAIARRSGTKFELGIYAVLIKQDHPLAKIDRELNALFIEGDPIGSLVVSGPGAGSGPTASAVVADLIDLAESQSYQKEKSLHINHATDLVIADLAEDVHSFYLRIEAKNESGVLAKLTQMLAEKRINIESILQKENHLENAVIVIITNPVKEADLKDCLAVIKRAAYVELVKFFRVNLN